MNYAEYNQLSQKIVTLVDQGKYKEAIAQWNNIALFLPNHVPSQQAIKTTETQLANLSRLNQDQP